MRSDRTSKTYVFNKPWSVDIPERDSWDDNRCNLLDESGIACFTDGSATEYSVGLGYVIYDKGVLLYREATTLSNICTVHRWLWLYSATKIS